MGLCERRSSTSKDLNRLWNDIPLLPNGPLTLMGHWQEAIQPCS